MASKSVLTAALNNAPRRSVCGWCCGKKFDPKHRGAARKCQRCRGLGSTAVGSTKR